MKDRWRTKAGSGHEAGDLGDQCRSARPTAAGSARAAQRPRVEQRPGAGLVVVAGTLRDAEGDQLLAVVGASR